jgi:hypothetical protein
LASQPVGSITPERFEHDGSSQPEIRRDIPVPFMPALPRLNSFDYIRPMIDGLLAVELGTRLESVHERRTKRAT